MGRWRDWRAEALRRTAPRPDEHVAVRCLRRLATTDARDRVFMLSGQAFIALFPLLIVTATLMSSQDGEAVARAIIVRFRLDDDVAEAVLLLFVRPPEATSGVGVVSLLLLLVSLNSFTRSLRRTFEQAWAVPRQRSVRTSVDGVLALALLLTMAAVVTWVRNLAEGTPWWVTGLPAQLAIAAVGWALGTWLLLSRTVPLRLVAPGALFAGVAQVVSDWGAGIYLPLSLARNAERFGGIGVAISLVYWLVIFAAVVVAVAVVGATLAERRRHALVPPAAAG